MDPSQITDIVPQAVIEQGKDIIQNGPLLLDWAMKLLTAAVILIAGWWLGSWLGRRLTRIKKMDQTLLSFLSGFVRYAFFAIAVITVLAQFGVQTASLLAVLGAAGLAIGLALQGTLSNVAAGVMLLVLRPFKVGDYITLRGAGGTGGTVTALGLFGTELETPDNVYIFMPNRQIWEGDIWNFTRNRTRRQDIRIAIGYDEDIGDAFAVIRKIIDADARVIKDRENKKSEIITDSLGDYAVNIIVRFWSKKEDYWALRWDMIRALKEGLAKAKIEIPYPTQVAIHKEEK